MRRSGSRRLFAESLRRFVPEIREDDLTGGGSGIRAQAMDSQGKLLDDFHFVDGDRTIHVLNAPSPGATASLAIGAEIARRARERFVRAVLGAKIVRAEGVVSTTPVASYARRSRCRESCASRSLRRRVR